MNNFVCRDSSVGLERLIVDQEVTGSNPVPGSILTIILKKVFKVEYVPGQLSWFRSPDCGSVTHGVESSSLHHLFRSLMKE